MYSYMSEKVAMHYNKQCDTVSIVLKTNFTVDNIEANLYFNIKIQYCFSYKNV